MKPLSILLSVLLLLVTGFTGYLYVTCSVTVLGAAAASTEARAQSEQFEEILAQYRAGAPMGVVFDTLPEGDAEDLMPRYRFITYHVQLRNTCFIPATTVEVEIVPRQGDVLQLPDPVQRGLPSSSEGILDAVLLSSVEGHTIRELRVTWYLWGIPFEKRILSN